MASLERPPLRTAHRRHPLTHASRASDVSSCGGIPTWVDDRLRPAAARMSRTQPEKVDAGLATKRVASARTRMSTNASATAWTPHVRANAPWWYLEDHTLVVGRVSLSTCTSGGHGGGRRLRPRSTSGASRTGLVGRKQNGSGRAQAERLWSGASRTAPHLQPAAAQRFHQLALHLRPLPVHRDKSGRDAVAARKPSDEVATRELRLAIAPHLLHRCRREASAHALIRHQREVAALLALRRTHASGRSVAGVGRPLSRRCVVCGATIGPVRATAAVSCRPASLAHQRARVGGLLQRCVWLARGSAA
eukprot:5144282-Prymnesium_polylepis.2